MRALLVVDYTNDFVADQGSLTAGAPAQALEDTIYDLIADFHSNGDFVVYPTDLHSADDHYHPENKLFPPHNYADTWGRELYGKLADQYQDIASDDNVYFYDKRRYSAFAGTDLDIRLRERGIKELYIVGVCTDICVLHTAVDAYNLAYDIVIPAQAVASFNQAGHEWALDHFKSCLAAKVID
ncbi:isochorismatase [Aerococcus urinaehominis]|uniref:Isochorismatase n=1 Tax=Aerococcus urinaehominis TaxID=128944 RepID=A0A0X8FLS8_9LACT|nr:isochorismatase family cysteine hydrolase [Aerococcus urinaehominis]AMB99677.1 isochorismatase [Aerococcus urinaehominis]SDL90017.1 Nicotinamidase-related amidase [Aerococcus urinaehominis]